MTARAAALAVLLVCELTVAAALVLRAPTSSDRVETSLSTHGREMLLTVHAGVDAQRTAQRVTAEIGLAVDAVVAFWGDDWRRDIVVDVTATEAQFAAALAGTGVESAFAGMAAVAVATWVDPANGTADGQRIVFAPAMAGVGDSGLRLVLRHELFHYAARTQTALDAPVWVTEAVADFVARPPQPTDVVAQLPADADFLGPEPARSRAYDQAWSFARFVADRYGVAALRQFYVRAAGAGHTDVASALREVLGASTSELLEQWADWQTAVERR